MKENKTYFSHVREDKTNYLKEKKLITNKQLLHQEKW